MKTILNEVNRRELTGRLDRLSGLSQALWGKMSASQMVKHCRLWEEMIHENKRFKRPLIGRLIGPMILRRVLRSPDFRKNSPTVPELVVRDTNIDLATERWRLIVQIESYGAYDMPDYSFIHPFFGKMTREEIGQMAYLHLDHHLKQFGG